MSQACRLLSNYAVYLVVRFLICVVQTLPITACASLAHALAWLANDLLRVRRRVIHDNLQQAFPQWSAEQVQSVARRMWEHLFLMAFEMAHVPRKIHETNWRKYVRFGQMRRLAQQLLSDRPSLLVSGHFGNFEVGGYVSGLLGFRTYTVARPLDNPFLHRFLHRFRSARGQMILPKNGSAQEVERILEEGGTMTLLGDQYAGPKGCWVDFLGRPASCHKALALFTLSTGAPMIVSYARRRQRPMRFELNVVDIADPQAPDCPPQGVRQLTQWYTDLLAEAIRETPDQYWWVHRRWKGAPPASAVRASARRAAQQQPAHTPQLPADAATADASQRKRQTATRAA